MKDIKDIIAKNLTELRTRAGFTQLQLAEKLNYSDKAVSKWERGEAVPDLRVLVKLSEIYGITVDDIVKGENLPHKKPNLSLKVRRLLVVALSVVFVWFVATGLFITFYFIPATEAYAYFAFVAAVLPTAIVLTVFSALWGNRITTAISSSAIVWSCAMIIYITVTVFAPYFTQIYLVWVAAAVFEILIILLFLYRSFLKNKIKVENGASSATKKEK